MEYDYDFDQSEPESRKTETSRRESRPDEPETAPALDLSPLTQIFRDQLMACLEECSAGRLGLFSTSHHLGEAARHQPWPEAERLRELAMSLQTILAQAGEADVAIDQFLDLCSIHGESDPGEPKLARAFLQELSSATKQS